MSNNVFIPLDASAFKTALDMSIQFGFTPMFISEHGAYLIPIQDVYALSKAAQVKVKKKIESLRMAELDDFKGGMKSDAKIKKKRKKKKSKDKRVRKK